MAKDMMAGFELYQPTQLNEAFALLDKFGKDGWKLAGGYDSLSWFKERNKAGQSSRCVAKICSNVRCVHSGTSTFKSSGEA